MKEHINNSEWLEVQQERFDEYLVTNDQTMAKKVIDLIAEAGYTQESLNLYNAMCAKYQVNEEEPQGHREAYDLAH